MNAINRIDPCRSALAAAIPPPGPHGGHLSLLLAAESLQRTSVAMVLRRSSQAD
jgi:hypothetical protein